MIEINYPAVSDTSPLPAGSCLLEGFPAPCAIVIMGASGDLTARKIMPSLFSLYKKKLLPDPCLILGCARTAYSDDEFRTVMKKALFASSKDAEGWEEFASRLYYRQIFYDDLSSYEGLATGLSELEKKAGTAGRRIFYLAVPPSLYESIALMLGEAGLSREPEGGDVWTRIVVEKPFGRDIETARHLDAALHKHFAEHQIFRIDHYLAKETVQNVLILRFANAIFEPIWNRRYVDNVSITAAESLGVGHRAGYYEEAGVLRDMFQNHMMQLLSLTAMDPPSQFDADTVRDEKVRVYRSLRPFPVDDLENHLIVGQYKAGVIDGNKVPGYREERGVSPDSLTPTFAAMKVFIDNWRWQGVPFYLTSGKSLAKKLTEIRIQFKEVPHSMLRSIIGEHITANTLTIGISPEEKITLSFQTKNPGMRICLRSADMEFCYEGSGKTPSGDAYEKVLMDVMLGDQMLFWRQDGVELCWSFLTPIIAECEACSGRAEMLRFYEAGSKGPGGFRQISETAGTLSSFSDYRGVRLT
ncbi:MAG: glucose-6-phosphate dehydrogenase [Deltaproteobacteria bacterium CG_4_8_14_3_um_filter_51_11]|nr:glucose-6-phosphate dehydrogenase [bacterium]OIP42448.1 MAG: glucose-6-phosphate dehydrogenase [Desulfobacteraceae bacterium CG2_30_51_40]PIP46242.1 MAG: glucose-6-phosphate dehydrogenase [Deltaproteobacteria bacterium CG23_combo_of_CG06-09_8_20_14_all_51_20]PIX21102.1 MAG: glucose-6-phosphate dehydrogenase [Deltaproteobacteria bacterium CG_4_8_14_3_um_filter_51_11]PJB37084.1 MAG: glucose-6-phosphate dehydrogenase [Deltaproteobacteria bacterium CG_4_9_14_3_um_filter_51_14]